MQAETTVQFKKQLGQFFTVNSNYVLQGLEKFVVNKNISDPFAGSGDLLSWARNNGAKTVAGFEIDKNLVDNRIIFYGDSLKEKRKYDFIVTNPPYLNINKADKETKEKYFKSSGFEDLYQISLNSILNSKEGIVVIPINFLSAENSRKIRNLFFEKFRIVKINYFKQQVFPDTTSNVITFYYRSIRKSDNPENQEVETNFFPEKNSTKIFLEKKFHWTIGGRIINPINIVDNHLKIRRLVESDIQSGQYKIQAAYNHIKNKKEVKVSSSLKKIINSNIMFLKAIDSGSENGKIALEDIRKHGVKCLISKPTSRHMIYLISDSNKLSINIQEKIIDLFNKEINQLRNDQFSLFLTNYRDKDRKRISFDFTYKFINYLYFTKILGQLPIESRKTGVLFS